MAAPLEMTKSEFNRRLDLVVEGIANDLRNELIEVAPVDTGRLKNSIKVASDGKNLTISMVEYALHVEYGTYKMDAQPFIRNTIRGKLKTIIVNNIKRQFS